jgi:hypothetical protein
VRQLCASDAGDNGLRETPVDFHGLSAAVAGTAAPAPKRLLDVGAAWGSRGLPVSGVVGGLARFDHLAVVIEHVRLRAVEIGHAVDRSQVPARK